MTQLAGQHGRLSLAVLALTAATASGCGIVEGLLGGGAEEATQAAEATLKSGDLPAAVAAYQAAGVDHAGDPVAATGAAYALMLQGRHAEADAALAAAEANAGESLPQLKLRRALVALDAGNLDAVAEHGKASGLPQGMLLAAEVALADGEREDARDLLGQAKGGSVSAAAEAYIELIDDEEPLIALLAEAQALWALGERKVAVKSAEELVRNLPEDRDDRSEQLLMWAGRAVSVREADIAQGLLDAMVFPPDGQQWRKLATQAMVHCVRGESEPCVQPLLKLDGVAPEDGLADARATAAYLIASEDPDAAKQLAGSYVSNAAARALVESGDMEAARESAPDGIYGKYLTGG